MHRLISLREFYERTKSAPETATDEEFLSAVRRTFWGTNSFAFVEASFAIIAPGCLLRPHLTKKMLRAPVRAAVASGVEATQSIVAWGVRCADLTTPDGVVWLTRELPALQDLVTESVAETLEWVAAGFPGDDLW